MFTKMCSCVACYLYSLRLMVYLLTLVILLSLKNAKTIEQFRSLLSSEEYDFRYNCGLLQPVETLSTSEMESVMSAITIHFSISSYKAELDQLVSGLRTLEVYTMHFY